ncbi:hypothetical protein B0H34DRAFT_228767 [Crassisporium funariophilum]|nr:hypothetical protein B0H34DRAFT_228767 [Crassisporium funariophilum]
MLQPVTNRFATCMSLPSRLSLLHISVTTSSLFHRSPHFRLSMPRSYSPDDIVVDSEPERERRRKVIDLPERVHGVLEQTNRKSEALMSVRSSFNSRAGQNTVIEISDSDSSPSVRGRPSNSQTFIQPRSALPESNLDNKTSFSTLDYSAPPKDSDIKGHIELSPLLWSRSLLSLDSDKYGYTNLNSSRFVSKDCRPAMNVIAPKNAVAGPSRTVTTTASSINKAKRPSKKKQLALDLSEDELAKVTRCICCGIKWTARKTGAQKLAHIQPCAKRNAYNDDTVRLLVQKEIINFVSLPTGKGKEKLIIKSALHEEPQEKKTFFEDVLVEAAPKKKTKRHHQATLIENVSIARDSILARAQSVIATATPNNADLQPDPISVDVGHNENNEHLPLTQGFTRSALVQRQGSRLTSLFADIHSSPSPEPPDERRQQTSTYTHDHESREGGKEKNKSSLYV